MKWLPTGGGLAVFGLWLAVPAAREYAIYGAGLLGVWLGAVSAMPDREGKRDPYGMILTFCLLLLTVRIGVRIWFAAASGHAIFHFFTDTHLLMVPGSVYRLESTLYFLTCSTLGCLCGVTAAAVGQNRRQILTFGAALLFVATMVLPWLAVAVYAAAGPPDSSYDWLKHILLLVTVFTLLLDLLLLTCAGFRRVSQMRRAWRILAATTLTCFGIWVMVELYFQWDVRQLRRQYAYHPVVLTPEEEHAVRLFLRVYEQKQTYDRFRQTAGKLKISPTRSAEPAPPRITYARWLPRQATLSDMLTDQKELKPAPEEYKQATLAMDATAECNAFYEAFETLLNENLLRTEPVPENPPGLLVRSKLETLTEWLTGRAQLRHYTGDTAGVIHYLDRALRVGELWPGDPSQYGQWNRYRIDQNALAAIVTLGPEGAEYADRYRDWLRRAQLRRYEQLSESQVLAADWDYVLSGGLPEQHQTRRAGFPGWFLNPLSLCLQARKFRESELAQAQFASIRQQVAAGIPWEPTIIPNDYRSSAESFLSGEALLQTALALKLYRSLHGEYPDSLEALVPELLPRLPNLAATGKPLLYYKLGSGFELNTPSGQHQLRPVANY